jgi:pimeloyl-ACP methyl ester carboxylesterase
VTVVSHAFSANDLTLVVHDWGGDGPPVLLAHPTGFHGRIWEPIADRLTHAGQRVYSFDFRGHGDSSAPDVADYDYSWNGFADDALAVAEHLGIARDPHLLACGHSKGGAALLLGEAAQPGTFARIWTYEPIMFDSEEPQPPDSDFFLARAARKRRNEWSSPDEAFASYSSKPPLNAMTSESLHAYVDYAFRDRGDGVYELKCRPEVEAQVYTMGPNHDAFRKLPGIDAPVAVVCGETSMSIDPPRAKRIAEQLPHGHVEVMPELGHFGPQQDPDACVASMLRLSASSE